MNYKRIEIVIPLDKKQELEDYLANVNPCDYFYWPYGGKARFRVTAREDEIEDILDEILDRYSHIKGFKTFILPISTVLPLPDVPDDIELDGTKEVERRLSREEIYSKIMEMTEFNSTYIAMTVFSAVVAAIGVLTNDAAVIVGAMIIAPLMGPNMGLSFGIYMADKQLTLRSFKTLFYGIVVAFIISFIMGVFIKVDPTIPSILLRSNVGEGSFVLALFAGFAGSLALITDISEALVGVMIAIALLPPLVTFGLLTGSNIYFMALGSFLILVINILSVILAAQITFRLKNIRPLYEKKHVARKNSNRYIAIIIVILVVLLILNVYQDYLGEILVLIWNY